jgi:hypothetical protein
MTLVASMITIDCTDPQRLASFWSAVLETPVERDLGDYVYLARPDDGGIVVSFQRVPEPTPGQARIHLDTPTRAAGRQGQSTAATNRRDPGGAIC